MKIACWPALALPWLMLLPAQTVDRNKPFPPHHVVGNVYFVGTADLQTGNLFWNRAFLNPPAAVSFSPDGTNWAWIEADES